MVETAPRKVSLGSSFVRVAAEISRMQAYNAADMTEYQFHQSAMRQKEDHARLYEDYKERGIIYLPDRKSKRQPNPPLPSAE